jgi:two-component system, OmpR family, response regulator CpxR
MSVVTIFCASHCHGEDVAGTVADRLGLDLLDQEGLLTRTAERFGIGRAKLDRAAHGSLSLLDKVTHERERSVAAIRACLAELMQQDNLVCVGPAGLLVPRDLPGVLRVCLVAHREHRIANATRDGRLSAKSAEKALRRDDEEAGRWSLYLFGLGPWREELYDIFLPMDSTSVDEAAEMIAGYAERPQISGAPDGQKSLADFLLGARVQQALAQSLGYEGLGVSASKGEVTVTINRYVSRLEKLEEEIERSASAVEGVKEISTTLGPHFRPPSIYQNMDLDMPPKFLLVDDEKEFVLTLSERLETRNLKSAVVHSGEEALSSVETDAPDVMVLDLKMPGIDGLEVLRRVKQDNPDTQVIILTGHGSDREEEQAMELGAFAYLSKPVDIDVLAETMRRAHAKLEAGRNAGELEGDDGA